MFEKKEWIAFIVAALVIGFALGFNDGGDSFQFSYWITNLLLTILMVAISILLYQWVQKTVAKMNGFKSEFKLWGVDTFHWGWWRGFMVKQKKDLPYTWKIFGKEITLKSFPLGVALSLIVTIVTNGNLFWLGVTHYDLLIKRSKRLGRKFINVTGYDEAKIALAGPFTAVSLIIVFSLININGTFDKFIMINTWIALFNMIPFFQFDGGKVWNGSRVLYVFSIIFIVAIVFLVHFLEFMPLLIVSIVLALIASALFFYYRYVKS